MAIPGAYTLGNLATISEMPLQKAVIMNLLRYTQVFQSLPFKNVEALEVAAARVTALPTPGFRNLNDSYTASVGDTEQVTEHLYPIGGEIKIDRVFQKVKNTIVDPKAQQLDLHMKALALTLNDRFINGDWATDTTVMGFEGLKKRASNMPSRQRVRFSATTDILDPTASAANARLFLDKWDECWYKCNSGQVGGIYTNEGMKWGIARVLRFLQLSGNFLTTSKDVWGREILEYKGVPIMDMGLKLDQATEIIPNNETAEDSGQDATSVYFASHDMQEGITGISLSALEAFDVNAGGESEDAPLKHYRYEWVVGLAGFGSHGLVRGHNIETPASWT